MDTKSVADSRHHSRPTFERLYAAYLAAVRDEEVRLGRQLTHGEAERMNAEVMAPLNRAVWAERSCEDV